MENIFNFDLILKIQKIVKILKFNNLIFFSFNIIILTKIIFIILKNNEFTTYFFLPQKHFN